MGKKKDDIYEKIRQHKGDVLIFVKRKYDPKFKNTGKIRILTWKPRSVNGVYCFSSWDTMGTGGVGEFTRSCFDNYHLYKTYLVSETISRDDVIDSMKYCDKNLGAEIVHVDFL